MGREARWRKGITASGRTAPGVHTSRGELTVYIPVPLKAEHRVALSRLIGSRDRHIDAAGREYLTLPVPYADVVLVAGETLTPAACARLVEALEYFERDPVRQATRREAADQASGIQLLKAATDQAADRPRSDE